MDDRDAALIAQIEAGNIDEPGLILLIAIVSRRRLGSDTIDGVKILDIDIRDPRFLAWEAHYRTYARGAFVLIRASHWYREDRWPVTPEVYAQRPEIALTFRKWVDLRLSSLDLAERIRLSRES